LNEVATYNVANHLNCHKDLYFTIAIIKATKDIPRSWEMGMGGLMGDFKNVVSLLQRNIIIFLKIPHFLHDFSDILM
jgi:hypothetical protein